MTGSTSIDMVNYNSYKNNYNSNSHRNILSNDKNEIEYNKSLKYYQMHRNTHTKSQSQISFGFNK
jgi:hypothetical protein